MLRQGLEARVISIHALREEGDEELASQRALFANFYPRPPRGGRLLPSSTAKALASDFYPRPPRGGRRDDGQHSKALREISIHALREEGDSFFFHQIPVVIEFLSTPSARRATWASPDRSGSPPISIHALREEGDSGFSMWHCHRQYFYPRPPRGGRQGDLKNGVAYPDFYPRPPRGGRPGPCCRNSLSRKFLSTPSARRATLVAALSVHQR